MPPGTAGLFLSRRLEELGPRISERTRDYSRAVAGLRGELRDSWAYDVWLTYTKTDEDRRLRNGASSAAFQQGLFVDPVTGQCTDVSDDCAPLNIWGEGNLSATGTDFLRLPVLLNTTTREQSLIGGYLRGAPFKTRAGAIDTVIGVEWRSDDGTFRADEALSSGDALGFRGSAGIDGRESVYEVYAEAVVPILADSTFAEYLGLEIGARYSDYDNAGVVNTYKIGGEWQPVEGFRFRTMFQHSVRAPSIAEAFQEQFVETFAFVGNDPAEDPCSASADPVGKGNVEECIATGLPAEQIGLFEAAVGIPTGFVRGGNPDLTPEEADTFTFGAVARFGESNNLQLSVDYFDLEITDTIDDLEATIACFDPANDQNLFCNNFTRDPNTFNVIELVETKFNLGAHRTSGIDTQLSFDATLPESLAIAGNAQITANVTWTHMQRNDIRALAFGTRLRCAGQFGFPCNAATDGLTFPEDRVSANVSYVAGDLGIYVNWRWISGTDNAAFLVPQFLGTPKPDLVITDIGSRSYLDLGTGYQVTDGIYARLNVSNVLDRDPPLMGSNAAAGNNTDTRLYDVFGRSYSLAVSFAY